jgi:translation initiation factor 2 beta subunit (eIF-2beta)/eIF-5
MSCISTDYIRVTATDYESKIAEAMTGMVGKIYLALIAKVLQLAKTMDYDELRAGKFCMRFHELTGPSIEELKNRILTEGVSREQVDSVIAEQLRLFVTHVDINSKLQKFAVQYREFKALREYKIIPKQDPKNGVHYWEVLVVSQPWTCC